MTPQQWDSLRTRNEWTHETAGEFFGVSPRTSKRWSAGGKIPLAVNVVAALMERQKLTPAAAARIAKAWAENQQTKENTQ